MLYLLCIIAVVYSPNSHASTFLSFDSRTMALGGAGTASARPNNAVLFNPALLISGKKNGRSQYFSHNYIGARVLDRDNFLDKIEAFDQKYKEQEFDQLLSNVHQLFSEGELSSSDIRELNNQTQSLLYDIQDLSNKPLRVAASYGFGVGKYHSELAFGVNFRRYIVGGAKITASSSDITNIQQILSTANAIANVVDSAADLETLIEESNFDEIIDLISTDADAGIISDELRNFADIPVVNQVIVAIESLQFNLEELNTYINLEDLYSALAAQDNGSSLNELSLGDTQLRNYLRYQTAENFTTSVEFSGADIDETSLSIGYRVKSIGKLNVGFTLKHQDIDVIGVSQTLDEINLDAYKSSTNRINYERFNADIGMTYQITEQWTAGVVIKNLLRHRLAAPVGKDIVISTIARAAIAYNSRYFLWALDYDLSKNEPLGFDTDKQYISSGIELKIWQSTVIRAGYRYNHEDKTGLPSLGVGLGFDKGHIDIALTASDRNDEYGASFQLGFIF